MSNLYDFGWPDELVRVHFPHNGRPPQNVSLPWYYYLTKQTPTYFQYIGSQLGGSGWQCKQFLPVIRILPIDTQKMTPTTEVGFGSLEEFLGRVAAGEPISQDAGGRFNFKNSFFWKVIGREPPRWASFANGLPTSLVNSPQRPVGPYITDGVNSWISKWNGDRNTFNGLCNSVAGNGIYGQIGAGSFALPFPPSGTPLPQIQADPERYYFGAIPPFAIFQQGQALIWKQSFSFQYAIGQLDQFEWDMSRFPPRRVARKNSSGVTRNFGGYTGINFPLTVPIIAGTS